MDNNVYPKTFHLPMFFKKSSIDTISVLLKKGESIEGRISLVRYLG